MSILWTTGIKHDSVLLFLSDAAAYMVKAAKSISAFYSKMIHVTCIAHGLHGIAEEIRNNFPEINALTSNVKIKLRLVYFYLRVLHPKFLCHVIKALETNSTKTTLQLLKSYKNYWLRKNWRQVLHSWKPITHLNYTPWKIWTFFNWRNKYSWRSLSFY